MPIINSIELGGIGTPVYIKGDSVSIEPSGNVTISGTLVVDKLELSTAKQGLLLAQGGASAGQFPLKFQSGTLLTTPELGAIEFNNDEYFRGTVNVAGTSLTRRTFLLGSVFNYDVGPALAGQTPGAVDFYGNDGDKILGQADKWIKISIEGAQYFIPAYNVV